MAKVATLLSFVITCPETGTEETASYSYTVADSQECEMCGSHGHATVTVDCNGCGKSHEIILSEW